MKVCENCGIEIGTKDGENLCSACMKVKKYLYGWKFYLNYGQGWEYEIFEETREGMKENRKAYRENCPQYPLKITRGRELNPDYRSANMTHSQRHGYNVPRCKECNSVTLVLTDGYCDDCLPEKYKIHEIDCAINFNSRHECDCGNSKVR